MPNLGSCHIIEFIIEKFYGVQKRRSSTGSSEIYVFIFEGKHCSNMFSKLPMF